MIAGPTKPTLQWGNREVVNGELKWRRHKSGWRSMLIGATIVAAFFVFLILLDVLG